MKDVSSWPDGFEAIYTQYHQKVHDYFWYRIGPHKEIADDLTQETFLRAFDHFTIATYNKTTYFRYLMTIAHNLLVNHYRKIKSIDISDLEQKRQIDDLPPLEQVIADTHEDLEQFIEHEDLERAIAKCSSFEQDILHMKYIQGLPIKEIAQKIQRTPTATKLLLFRIRNKIRINCASKDE